MNQTQRQPPKHCKDCGNPTHEGACPRKWATFLNNLAVKGALVATGAAIGVPLGWTAGVATADTIDRTFSDTMSIPIVPTGDIDADLANAQAILAAQGIPVDQYTFDDYGNIALMVEPQHFEAATNALVESDVDVDDGWLSEAFEGYGETLEGMADYGQEMLDEAGEMIGTAMDAADWIW